MSNAAWEFAKKHPVLTVGGGLAAAGGIYLLYLHSQSGTSTSPLTQGQPSTSYLYPGQNVPGVSATSGSAGGSGTGGLRGMLSTLSQKLAGLSGQQAQTQAQVLAQQQANANLFSSLQSRLSGLTNQYAQTQSQNQEALASVNQSVRGLAGQVSGLSTRIKGTATTPSLADASVASAKPATAMSTIRSVVVSSNPLYHPGHASITGGGYGINKSNFTGGTRSGSGYRPVKATVTPITLRDTLVSQTPLYHPGRPSITSGGSSGYGVQRSNPAQARATQTRTQKASNTSPMIVQRGRFRAFA